MRGRIISRGFKLAISLHRDEDIVFSIIKPDEFIPLGKNAEVVRKVFSAIKEGYVSRNPLRGDWTHDLGDLQTCIRNKDASFSNLSGTNANACGFCVIGDSGMGKTTAVNHALKLFPQVIIHRNYQGTEFPHMQLVWIYGNYSRIQNVFQKHTGSPPRRSPLPRSARSSFAPVRRRLRNLWRFLLRVRQ